MVLDGLNTYGYVGGNPVSYIDLEGLAGGPGFQPAPVYRLPQPSTPSLQEPIGNIGSAYKKIVGQPQDRFDPQVGIVCKRNACDQPRPQNQCTAGNSSGAPLPAAPSLTNQGSSACPCIEYGPGWVGANGHPL